MPQPAGACPADGLTVATTNYCLRALLEKGYVKVVNFNQSLDKRACLYCLTPLGLRAKVQATRRVPALRGYW